MHQHLNYRGPRIRREKEGSEKIFEDIAVENFPNMGKEIIKSPGSTESPIQDKPKEKHAETCINQSKKKN